MATAIVLVACYYGYNASGGRSAWAGRRPSRWCSTWCSVTLIGMLGTQVFWGTESARSDRWVAGIGALACSSCAGSRGQRPPATLPPCPRRCCRREALRGAGPRARAAGPFKKQEGFLEGPDHVDHVGRGSPRAARRTGSLRRQIQELADGRPADRARALQARRARRALAQADVGRHQAARPRGHRGGRQRLRRRARGRADLRLPVREGQRQEAGQTAVAELDDERRDEERARLVAPRRGVRAASSRPRARARRRTGSSA